MSGLCARIPVTVMDEHCDGYWHWYWFIERGVIPPKGNALLHIDHHEDNVGGGYAADLDAIPETAQQAKALVDRAFGIADFILPAVWQGVFSSVHILKNLLPMPLQTQEMFLRLQRCEGGSFLQGGNYIPFLHAEKRDRPESGYRFYTAKSGGLNPNDEIPSRHLVLDVDLDYFAWDNSLSTVGPKRIEVTEASWREFLSNRSHPLRITPKRYLFPVEEDGRYYLEYREGVPAGRPTSRERIDQRMDRLFGWFGAIGLRPAAIDVCRSSHSGYLPADCAAYVEEAFFRRLEAAFPIERIAL